MNAEELIAAIEEDNFKDARSIIDQLLLQKVGYALTEKKKTLGDSLVGEKDIEEEDDSEYEAFFRKAMKKFNITSPEELDTDEKKKKFFDYIDKNYKAKKESVNESRQLQGKDAMKEIDPTMYYAYYFGYKSRDEIAGPYKSEDSAYRDNGGDLEDIIKGVDLISQMKKGKFNNATVVLFDKPV